MKILNHSWITRFAGGVASLIVPAIALAEPTVTVPTTQPAGPVNPLTEGRALSDRILILPFEAVNAKDVNFWLGKSIQQSLQADLTSSAPGRVVTDNQAVPNVEAAIRLAREHDARYVIAGGFATADRTFRITGQVIDASTGQAIGSLKATGETSQIFSAEDDIARQVRGQLFPAAAPAAALSEPNSAPQVRQQADAGGVRTDYTQPAPYYSSYATVPTAPVYGASPDAYTYSYTTYPSYSYYDSGVPAYSYSYPLYNYGYYSPFVYGFGLGISFGGFHHYRDAYCYTRPSYHNYNYGHNSYYHGNYSYSGGQNHARYNTPRPAAPGVIRFGATDGAGVIRNNPNFSNRGFSAVRSPTFAGRSTIGAGHGSIRTPARSLGGRIGQGSIGGPAVHATHGSAGGARGGHR